MFEVSGPTLTLRLPAAEHIPGLFRLARDPDVTRWFSWGPYEAEDQPRAWVLGAAARRAAGERLELVIERAGEPLGVTTLMSSPGVIAVRWWARGSAASTGERASTSRARRSSCSSPS